MATKSIEGQCAVSAQKGSMTSHRSFGRRSDPKSQPSRSMEATKVVARSTSAESTSRSVQQLVMPSERPQSSLLEDDLQDWKLARKHNFTLPWRQISLMAALCFGIASLLLPDSVNDSVQWLIYALASASLYAGICNRGRKTKMGPG